jgi:hypothetical protein
MTGGGDKVNSGMGLSYWPAILHRLVGPVRQPYAGVNFIPPVRAYEFGYWLRATARYTTKYPTCIPQEKTR